jgi:aspartate racemase
MLVYLTYSDFLNLVILNIAIELYPLKRKEFIFMIRMDNFQAIKKIGIVAHSYEGGSLCFITACREGASLLGPHMHPNIIVSAIPMGLSLSAWESDNYLDVQQHLIEGIDQVARGGADFFVCPDNTAHIVLEDIVSKLPIPGLHIADVVCREINLKGWKNIGLLGTKWTMTGSVYSKVLKRNNFRKIIPQEVVNEVIFEELCQGVFYTETIDMFLDIIKTLKKEGAECVILGCTEIPLIITSENSPLPVLDSTRLLANYAIRYALLENSLVDSGWINPNIIV